MQLSFLPQLTSACKHLIIRPPKHQRWRLLCSHRGVRCSRAAGSHWRDFSWFLFFCRLHSFGELWIFGDKSCRSSAEFILSTVFFSTRLDLPAKRSVDNLEIIFWQSDSHWYGHNRRNIDAAERGQGLQRKTLANSGILTVIMINIRCLWMDK